MTTPYHNDKIKTAVGTHLYPLQCNIIKKTAGTCLYLLQYYIIKKQVVHVYTLSL